MIKKIIACLTICFIITGIISPVFSDASALPQPNWSDPGISEIINISDLTGWMLNGGTYDVSTYTDAESFMNDYFAARTKTRLEGSDYQIKSSFGLEQTYYEVGDSAYNNPLDINRVIASSYRDHSGYGRRLSNEVNDVLLSSGSLYDTKIPLLNEVEFANFVGYNHDALRLYSEFFNQDNEDPSPNPDPDYEVFVNQLTSSTVNGLDLNTGAPYRGSNNHMVFNFTRPCSWCCQNPNSATDWAGKIVAPINNTSIYITTNLDGSCSWSASLSSAGTIQRARNSDNYVLETFISGYLYIDFKPDIWFTEYGTFAYPTTHNFSSLTLLFNYIVKYFKYVNVYVNEELWGLAGNSPIITPTITPEFPDAVGGEDIPSTTWPISRPRAPYYTSVPGVLQAIEDAIADDGKLDIDDLKPYLTDENGDPVPDPIFDPEPVPIPVPDPVNPDIVPGLPILPAIPPEMPGFSGVSVLAEIINFTNQSLPTALIVTFWGIVFGIVILGLIKILHK